MSNKDSFWLNYKGDWKVVREGPEKPWHLFNLQNGLAEAGKLAAVQK